MSDPVTTYGAEIIARDGIRISGNVQTGVQAVIRYLVPWQNAYLFVNALVQPLQAVTVGPITYHLPYRLPPQVVATPCYAQGFDIQPVGLSPGTNEFTPLPFKGMGAGEFYEFAIVTVQFQQIFYTWDATDDPNGQNQLDPTDPILFCEQSVKLWDKLETRKGLQFKYSSGGYSGKPVTADVPVPVSGAELTLHFPHVPYLPWRALIPYVNTVNSGTIFNCPPQTIRMMSPETTAKQAMGGGQGPSTIEQSLVLKFQYNADGWNSIPGPDGLMATVARRGDSTTGIFKTADFRPLLALISFSQAT